MSQYGHRAHVLMSLGVLARYATDPGHVKTVTDDLSGVPEEYLEKKTHTWYVYTFFFESQTGGMLKPSKNSCDKKMSFPRFVQKPQRSDL